MSEVMRNWLVSSLEVEAHGGHDHVRVWTRGGLAGTLVTLKGDGEKIAARLRDVHPLEEPAREALWKAINDWAAAAPLSDEKARAVERVERLAFECARADALTLSRIASIIEDVDASVERLADSSAALSGIARKLKGTNT